MESHLCSTEGALSTYFSIFIQLSPFRYHRERMKRHGKKVWTTSVPLDMFDGHRRSGRISPQPKSLV